MFTVYSKVGCDYCDAVEKLLTIKKIAYEKRILNVDYTRDEFIEQFGVTTFPRVLNEEGELIGGAKETAVYLKKNGLV